MKVMFVEVVGVQMVCVGCECVVVYGDGVGEGDVCGGGDVWRWCV